ncbi:acetylornithine deacetylase [Kribbella aluminosa]|uniref:Acetylornithine deacetylase n=1 Tax=Kribbella aluminosa TaxID=416017 RepID=A0ABS4UZA8_9ACTN|nr:M20 family metallopeptidase [Kribbella aluminosa]MBP2356965.1 acetylornithine deacetylase [Kribbella aluminosa]
MSLTRAEWTVLDRIDEDLLVRVTQELVRAPGQNPPGEEAATVAVLAGAARDLGLDVRTSPVETGRDNLSVRLSGGDAPGLLLLGHTDVVPVGDGWTVDPYGGLLRDGRIYGRGASDMKGGLAAALAALAALRGTSLNGPVDLAAVVDEEETGKGIRAYIASTLQPPVDNSSPTNAHTDRLEAERTGAEHYSPNAITQQARRASRQYVGCITAEPTDLQTIIAARGDSYLQVSVHGRASHAGNPDGGANAIYGAAAVVAEIERLHKELAAAPHPLLGPATWSVGQINGGTGGSIVPADCVVVADRRLLPGESPAEVLANLEARVASLRLEDRGLTVELSMPMEMPAFETSEDHDLVRATEAARFDAGGPPMPLAGWTAACDGGYVARDLGVPVVVLGPGSVTTQAHRADESVAIAELVTAARAYALIALRLLGTTG